MSTSHHILLVTRNFPPLLGGMERLNQHLLEELERNYAVHLVGPQGAAEHVAHPERVSTCPSAPVYAFLACAALKAVRSARRHRPGLIIAGSGVNAPPAWMAARASKTPWIVYLHGLDLVVDHLAYQRIFLPIIRRADAWLVNSRSTARLAVAAGLDADRLHVLHPGVAIPETLPSAEAVRHWREKHGLGSRPLLLSVGRLTKRKGLREFVLRALPQILATHPEVLLVVVGEEPHAALTSATGGLDALREATQQTAAQENLKILGKLSDEELGMAYRAAAVLVFPVLDIPGDVEGFGMVAIEAAAHGLPTVAFAVGGVPDAVAEGRSGLLIASGDYEAMADAILRHLAVPESALTGTSCQTFASQHTWEHFGTKLRTICHQYLLKEETPD
ncbi:MAG: glycosyltransferase family 1 protein [Candidatus Competibacteraceae bacterium]|nr:MAG: glycosyltransferase family 1 protein [Candidatus Competibacteraceae bacterium]